MKLFCESIHRCENSETAGINLKYNNGYELDS